MNLGTSITRWRRIAAAALCVTVLSACGGGDGAGRATGDTAQAERARALAAGDAAGWTPCAVESGVCNFSGTREVRYGAEGHYAYQTATGSIACDNSVFGDPVPGADKVCEYAAQAPSSPPVVSWTQCAVEYGTCSFTGTRQVRYGLDGQYAVQTATGSIACNNDVFGDPAPGANKVCEVAGDEAPATPPAPTWTQCAVEYGMCTFSGTRQVRYGLDGQYAFQTASGSIACNNDVFGDPAPGANKVCEVSSEQATGTPGGAPGPFGQNAADYTPTFSEEFNGATLDAGKWNDSIWYQEASATKNYAVEDGKLKIWPQRDASGNFFNRTIDTDGKYYQTYGYFEVEAKLPVGKGTWPAFWLFNHIGERRPEMDVMEAYPGGAHPWGFEKDGVLHPQAYGATVWKGDHPNQTIDRLGFRQYDTGVDLSAGFHKYAVKWEPNKQTYYFDGKPVLTVDAAMSDPMYLMLDLWFGGESGQPDHTTPQGKSNSYEVNYVRAWKFGGSPAGAQRIVEYHGDSTVWGYRSGQGGQVAQPAPAAFAEALKASSPAIAYDVRNEGVSGSTACDLLNGTDGRHAPWSQHIAASNAHYVIINHAINDEWKVGVAGYQSCLRQLARLAKARGKQVVFETPNPTRDSGPAGLDRYADAMRQVAAQEQVPVIDQYANLMAYLDGRQVTVICPDGLHPTQEVYAMKGRYAAQRFGAWFGGQ